LKAKIVSLKLSKEFDDYKQNVLNLSKKEINKLYKNKKDLKTDFVLKIRRMGDEKIRVIFQTKEKINYISDSNFKTMMPLKNSASDYEIEGEFNHLLYRLQQK
jgi:hypothetical protein